MHAPSPPAPLLPTGFDVGGLLEIAGDDGDFLVEIASLFEKDASRLLSEIRRAASGLDGEGLERSAHALKGLISHFGETRALDLCAALELQGLGRDLEGAEAISEALGSEVAQIRSGLKWLIDRYSSSPT